jgi:hypothetical protein
VSERKTPEPPQSSRRDPSSSPAAASSETPCAAWKNAEKAVREEESKNNPKRGKKRVQKTRHKIMRGKTAAWQNPRKTTTWNKQNVRAWIKEKKNG